MRNKENKNRDEIGGKKRKCSTSPFILTFCTLLSPPSVVVRNYQDGALL